MTDFPPVLRTYVDGLKTHNVQMVASAVSEDLAFVSRARTLNKSQFLDMLEALYAAFPDWHYDHAPPEIREGGYAIKWQQGGTHSGTFALPGRDPIEPTGRTVTIPEQWFFYRICSDEIVEIRPAPVSGGAPEGILTQIGITKTTL
jgi:predicted ester cyclase